MTALLKHLHPRDQELVEALSDDQRRRLGAPDEELAEDRNRAHELVLAMLDESPGTVRVSPLGPAWSNDIDVTISRPPAGATLEAAGWHCLDRLLDALGSNGRGRWLVVDDGRPVGLVDFDEAVPTSLVDPVDRIVRRAIERGVVDLRDVLELRVAARSGRPLPRNEVVAAAARLEAGLGGAALAVNADGPPIDEIARLGTGRTRRRLARCRRWLRPRPVVALSGVDGSGKSSLTTMLADDLRRAGLDVDVIWTRPGMRMHWADRLLGSRSSGREPTVALVARGEDVTAASRRGFVGWSWTMLVTLTFLGDVWQRHLRRPGLKLYDRHAVDALVTLDFVYAGVDLRVQRLLIRLALPPSASTYYLRIEPEVAVARKPGDDFGLHAVETQLDKYDQALAARPEVVVLDGSADPRTIANGLLVDLIDGEL